MNLKKIITEYVLKYTIFAFLDVKIGKEDVREVENRQVLYFLPFYLIIKYK